MNGLRVGRIAFALALVVMAGSSSASADDGSDRPAPPPPNAAADAFGLAGSSDHTMLRARTELGRISGERHVTDPSGDDPLEPVAHRPDKSLPVVVATALTEPAWRPLAERRHAISLRAPPGSVDLTT
jgi:hypothetical protein